MESGRWSLFLSNEGADAERKRGVNGITVGRALCYVLRGIFAGIAGMVGLVCLCLNLLCLETSAVLVMIRS